MSNFTLSQPRIKKQSFKSTSNIRNKKQLTAVIKKMKRPHNRKYQISFRKPSFIQDHPFPVPSQVNRYVSSPMFCIHMYFLVQIKFFFKYSPVFNHSLNSTQCNIFFICSHLHNILIYLSITAVKILFEILVTIFKYKR